MKIARILAVASLCALGACTAQQKQSACATFKQAENSPLVQLAVAGVSAATGGSAGLAVTTIKAFGDNYCAAGPPAGDTTTPAQQEDWLINQVTEPMLKAAGAK